MMTSRESRPVPYVPDRGDSRLALYGDPRSNNTQKVALMLALTGTPVEFIAVDIMAGENRSDWFRAMNQFVKVPVLVDGRLTIRQSHDALYHLVARTGRFGPCDYEHRLRIGEWLGFSADYLSRGTVRVRHLTRLTSGDPAVVAHYRTTAERGVAIIERHLTGRLWLTGDEPTIADLACYPGLIICPEADFDLAVLPSIAAWLARIGRLPGFAKANAILHAPASPSPPC